MFSPKRRSLAREPVRWTEREFTFNLPIGMFPAVLERVRGTPARASELVSGAPEELLSMQLNHRWSVKEHLGHLGDLHSLEERRLREFWANASILSAADPTNRVTETAGHNQVPVGSVLAALRAHRADLVRELENLSDEDLCRSAIHPRLRVAMRMVDWVYFIAEHDDHHLAQARQVLDANRLWHKFRGEDVR